jgi:hypothetical protein
MRPRLRLGLVVAAAGLAVGAGLVVPSGGAQSPQSVTLAVHRVYDSGNRIFRFRFSGSVSNRAAGEYVTVMQQRCGYSFATAIAGAQTRAGGFWEAESMFAPRPEFDTNTYFARWGNARSRPVVFRGKLVVQATRVAKGHIRVTVWRGGDTLQDMRGRQVVLQRLVAGRWTRIGAKKLRVDPEAFSGYVATFTVRTRGWTLRAFVPARNARPCFNQSASERIRS